MLIKLWDQRRSMAVTEVSEEIRDKASIYGIINSHWKQKEYMIKIETQKAKLHNDTHKNLLELLDWEKKIILKKSRSPICKEDKK